MQESDKRKALLTEITLTTLCHATEDCDKVKQALLNLIPQDIASSAQILADTMKGFYGNTITRFELRAHGNDAQKVLEHIAKLLSESDRRYIISSLEIRYDRKSNKVFIRIDKQSAYLKTPFVSEGDDVVKIVLSFSMLRSLDSVREVLEEIFFGPKK
ncbi:MAG: RNA-binding domain-containing protein [Ignisphaera sp.]